MIKSSASIGADMEKFLLCILVLSFYPLAEKNEV